MPSTNMAADSEEKVEDSSSVAESKHQILNTLVHRSKCKCNSLVALICAAALTHFLLPSSETKMQILVPRKRQWKAMEELQYYQQCLHCARSTFHSHLNFPSTFVIPINHMQPFLYFQTSLIHSHPQSQVTESSTTKQPPSTPTQSAPKQLGVGLYQLKNPSI